ncbi:gamma-tubulin complex component 5 [Cinnamomum micranthum f. kanehirae]|uniref:Gamma-tubulin complex component n=1 Tax=Cinnamomum micranthum f. kanehirae TaxID=337451 RepID=A0A443NC06_9MAGN|nr:gamma-tubulin complex component 5 [Cinnamomum micranthum f. kanehirae]
MENPLCYADGAKTEVSLGLIDRLYNVFSTGLPFAAPVSNLRTNESELVRGVLQMLQGFSSSFFNWNDSKQTFHVKNGIYVSHLSQTSLSGILSQFVYTATCLKLVELFVQKVEIPSVRTPTLKAFANSVSVWLKRLRNVALREEMKSAESHDKNTFTLLGLASTLSSLCCGAECLLQVVQGAIPEAYLDPAAAVPAGEMAVHILDHLYTNLNEVCPVQGGEEEAYHMLLVVFIGCLLPYIEGLDSWLFDGTLDDPYEELFFYANDAIAIDQPAYWEKSYLLRVLRSQKLGLGTTPVAADGESMKNDTRGTGGREPILPLGSIKGKDQNDADIVCPLFIKDIAKAIVSAGKSLQLMRHVLVESTGTLDKGDDCENRVSEPSKYSASGCQSTARIRRPMGIEPDHCFDNESAPDGRQMHHVQSLGGLTLSEVFCVSLAGLIGDRTHIFKYFKNDYPWTLEIAQICESYIETKKGAKIASMTIPSSMASEKIWCNFLVDTMLQKSIQMGSERGKTNLKYVIKGSGCCDEKNEVNEVSDFDSQKCIMDNTGDMDGQPFVRTFWPENPAITVCREIFNEASCNKLNLSRNFCLPSLNDENLREAIFGGNHTNNGKEMNVAKEMLLECMSTNYAYGFLYGESDHLRVKDDMRAMEDLFPFPTLLPCFQDLPISKLLPFQRNSTLASNVWSWLESNEPKATPLPAVIMQECLTVYIKKQVDYVGKHILLKLMNGWRLMDELGVLRAIYLLGSGDLLQQFLTVLFDKLDRGDSWDDDFELNTVLQESIRNSGDGMLLTTVDSLVAIIAKPLAPDEEHTATSLSTPRKGRAHSFGIDALDMLKFTYKASNQEAIKKYNQVMGFLLKVKRAKFVLDKARRWMWKDGGTTAIDRKHHLLVEQKLLHFVDAFHQYVMDRVFHSAWVDLCRGMSSAGSLDEVIEVHEAYLLSIQRQCFVAPDKLWALIASRIKSILGLALDFYAIQQTLCSGGAAPAIKARCEMEVDRIEKQFDDCIAFLLRVLSFKLNVGHFPHLADLVTRINYNYFYMSDTGNLLTIPGSDPSASKMGKTFPVKIDS